MAERIGDKERVAAAHYLRVVAQLQVGDLAATEADLKAMSGIAAELRQPAQLWLACAVQAMLALAAGRLTEAEALVPQALALGERAVAEIAIPTYGLQQYTLYDFRGSLEEAEPAIRDLVVAYPARPFFRCALAHLKARLGQLPEAKRALDQLSQDRCSALPFDQEWLYGMSLLAETCVLLSDSHPAAVLSRLLTPWAGFNAVDLPEGTRGAVSRYLGLLFDDDEALGGGGGALRECGREELKDGRSPLARPPPGRLCPDAARS